MLAGIAVLASCAKEIAPDVYEQAPAAAGKYTIVADRGDNADTKVEYNPLEKAALRTTWEANDKLGIFTYKPRIDLNSDGDYADSGEADEWTNNNVRFGTTELFAGKTSAAFTGNLSKFGGTTTLNNAQAILDAVESYIWGVYPQPADENVTDGVITFGFQYAEGTEIATDYDFDPGEYTVATRAHANVKTVGTKKYIPNTFDGDNGVILFRSSEQFSLKNSITTGTPLPTLSGVPLATKINLTLTKKAEEENMNEEVAVLKSVTLTALDESGEEVKAFHTQMKTTLSNFENIAALKIYDNEEGAVAAALYPNTVTEAVESLKFTINDYRLFGDEEIVLPIFLYPTEPFKSIRCKVEWEDNAGVVETTTGIVGWKGASSEMGPNYARTDWTVNLGTSIGTTITELPSGTTDIRTWIISAIEKGKTHIKVGDGTEPALMLYNHAYADNGYKELLDHQHGLIIPADASGKDIVIEAYVKNAEGALFSIEFPDEEEYDYDYENSSLTFIMKNTLESGKTKVIINNKKANVTLSAAANKSYGDVELVAAGNFTLAADAANLILNKEVKANKVEIASGTATNPNTVTEITPEDDIAPAINKIVVARYAEIPALAALNVPYVEINGTAGHLMVYPTSGTGTVVKTGANSSVASIYAFPVDDDHPGKYASFELNGPVSGMATVGGVANQPLNTQNAPSVSINGDLLTNNANVDVVVNGTTETEGGTEVTIGGKIHSLQTVKAAGTAYKSFTIDGTIADFPEGATVLDTQGAATVTVGSKTTGNTASVPALKTSGNPTVIIGAGAKVASLDPDQASSITINGEVTDPDANGYGLRSLYANSVSLGAAGKIGGNVWIAPWPKSSTSKVTFVGGSTGEGVSGSVTVAHVSEFTSTAAVEKAFDVTDVDAVKITVKNNDNQVNLWDCGGTVTVTEDRNNGNTPKVVFNNCENASFTLVNNQGANNQTIENVKNITIKGGVLNNASLTAGGTVTLTGWKKSATNTQSNTVTSVKIKASDISIDQYNTFDPDGATLTLSATSSVNIEGKGYAAANLLDMTIATVVVDSATSFNMKYVKVGKVYSYVDATLTDCDIAVGAEAFDENNCLAHVWKASKLGSAIVDDENPLDLNLTALAAAADVKFNLVYKNIGAGVDQSSIKTFFATPKVGLPDGELVDWTTGNPNYATTYVALINALKDKAYVKFDKDNVAPYMYLTSWANK